MNDTVPGMAQFKETLDSLGADQKVVGIVAVLLVMWLIHGVSHDLFVGDPEPLSQAQVSANLEQIGTVALVQPPEPAKPAEESVAEAAPAAEAEVAPAEAEAAPVEAEAAPAEAEAAPAEAEAAPAEAEAAPSEAEAAPVEAEAAPVEPAAEPAPSARPMPAWMRHMTPR